MNAEQSMIADAIRQEEFISSYDGTLQTYLLKDFRPFALERCPLLVVYLHGALNHQEQGMTFGIYNNAFGRLGHFLEMQEAVYVCPEYRGNSWMGPAAEQDVSQIFRVLKNRYRPAKTLLIGGSMGGTSALIYAMRHHEDIDAVLAFCPASDPAEVYNRDNRFRAHFLTSYGGSPLEKPEEYRLRTSRNFADQLAALPIVLVHGTHDATIPVEHSIRLAEALKKAGARFHFEKIDGGGHDRPLEVSFDEFFHFLGF